MDWVIDELDQFDQRDGDRFYITEENKQVLRDIAPFWEHNTTKRARPSGDAGIGKRYSTIWELLRQKGISLLAMRMLRSITAGCCKRV